MSAMDPADSPSVNVSEQTAPSLSAAAALLLQHRGATALDAHVVAAPSDALSFELRQAFGVRALTGDDGLPYPLPIASDALALVAWRPGLFAGEGHAVRALTEGAIVAPFSFASFGRTLGGAAAALGFTYRYVAAAQAWRVDVRSSIDGVTHPVTWPLRVDGDLSGVAASGLGSLGAGEACSTRSLGLFRYGCATSDLVRFGATLEIEARAVDDNLALAFAAARTQGVLRTLSGPLKAEHIAGTSAVALRASWAPMTNLDIGVGSLWWQAPYALDGPRTQAAVQRAPLVPNAADVLRETTWFVDVIASVGMP